MSDVVIRVEGLGKKYRIGIAQPYNRLSEVLAGWGQAALRLPAGLTGRARQSMEAGSKRPGVTDFWALQDINFEVKQGDVLGIIGRNGAGKSTLLKILSRITEPTVGRFGLKGRVASLLEVGTGFHSELTGRENIYLSGSLLGMTRKEIKRQFEAIVDFAGVETFLDTPVKRYSSGMQVRLGFAIAAHLEPEILIVDEVLAVGDAEFQKKCLGKMGEVSREGRTILFVSHNEQILNKLCTSGLLLVSGHSDGVRTDFSQLLSEYLRQSLEAMESDRIAAFDSEWVRVDRFYVSDSEGTPLTGAVPNTDPPTIHLQFEVKKTHSSFNVGYEIRDEEGTVLYWSNTTDTLRNACYSLTPGHYHIEQTIPPHLLNEGRYTVHLMSSLHFIEWIAKPLDNSPSIQFEIFSGLSDSPFWIAKRPGVIAPVLEWKVNEKHTGQN